MFSPEEAEGFIRQPFASEAVSVRLWDDAAKVAGAVTPSFAEFAALLRTVASRAP